MPRRSHGHNDKLSIALRYGDLPLLVDSGIAVYSGEFEWARKYVQSTKAHSNTLLGGRFGQNAAFEHMVGEASAVDPSSSNNGFAKTPLPSTDYKLSKESDFVRASVRLDTGSDAHFGASNCSANHTRALHYVRGKSLWLVVDRMHFDRDPARCDWSAKGAFLWSSWHVHPNATVNATCATAATLASQQRCLASIVHKSGNASLAIAMATDVKHAIFNSTVVKGINDSQPDVTGPVRVCYCAYDCVCAVLTAAVIAARMVFAAVRHDHRVAGVEDRVCGLSLQRRLRTGRRNVPWRTERPDEAERDDGVGAGCNGRAAAAAGVTYTARERQEQRDAGGHYADDWHRKIRPRLED